MKDDGKIHMFQAWFSWQCWPDGFVLLSDYTFNLNRLSHMPQYFGILNYPDGPVGGVLFASIQGKDITTRLIPNN